MDATVFLTGATGLVGRFILAELLRQGLDVAVLVRDDPQADAVRRVEGVLQNFEQHVFLPRPRVIRGALDEKALGIADDDIQWLESRQLDVIHCAASIRFVSDDRSGEPYRTNVEGTSNLLELLKNLRVRNLHHVSTAYVGARAATDVIPETTVDDVGLGGNDYERSKIQAEALVRRCQLTGRIFIHRPSIVIGDSVTGFSSTFHGFYAPLQIGAQFAQLYGFTAGVGKWFREQLGLRSDDSKNLVPVDWVAKCIADVVTLDEERVAKVGSTSPIVLHWTNPNPVDSISMQNAITDAIEEKFGHSQGQFADPQRETLQAAASETSMLEGFRKQLTVYESYFNGDPDFDRRISNGLLPEVVCPSVDYELLRKLAKFALECNFGWPKSAPPVLQENTVVSILNRIPTAEGERLGPALSLQLLGPGAPERISFAKLGGAWQRIRDSEAETLVQVPLATLTDCLADKRRIFDLFDQGRAILLNVAPDRAAHRDELAIISDWWDEVTALI